MKHAEGSARIHFGDTIVLVSASVEKRVPPFRVDTGLGWITAEYAMLPRATHTRSQREVSRGRPSGRSSEIQRLIGRSLRAAVDMKALGEVSVTLDCDVLQADGGTRTAAITGAYVALYDALASAYLVGDIKRWPIEREIAAVSVGIVSDQLMLDLEYREDSRAQVDMNVVATGGGTLIEVQATAEQGDFTREQHDGLIDLALAGIAELTAQQREVLSSVTARVKEKQARGSRPKTPPKDEESVWQR